MFSVGRSMFAFQCHLAVQAACRSESGPPVQSWMFDVGSSMFALGLPKLSFLTGVQAFGHYNPNMTHTGKMLRVAWASLALCTTSHGLTPASSSANPYQGIVDRNVFALKPPPPPPPPPAVDNTKPTGPKIILTGITTILGKRALMKATLPRQNEPGKPPEPAKEESFMLKEGERQGEIEVLEINDKL